MISLFVVVLKHTHHRNFFCGFNFQNPATHYEVNIQESKYCHVSPLLFNLHWLPVKFRIDFKILLLTYKAINGLAPFYLKELINLKKPCKYKLRSDCDGLLLNTVKFKTLTTLGDRSFAVAAPKLWNLLPYVIRSSPSVASFKQTLKTFLFQKAFL